MTQQSLLHMRHVHLYGFGSHCCFLWSLVDISDPHSTYPPLHSRSYRPQTPPSLTIGGTFIAQLFNHAFTLLPVFSCFFVCLTFPPRYGNVTYHILTGPCSPAFSLMTRIRIALPRIGPAPSPSFLCPCLGHGENHASGSRSVASRDI